MVVRSVSTGEIAEGPVPLASWLAPAAAGGRSVECRVVLGPTHQHRVVRGRPSARDLSGHPLNSGGEVRSRGVVQVDHDAVREHLNPATNHATATARVIAAAEARAERGQRTIELGLPAGAAQRGRIGQLAGKDGEGQPHFVNRAVRQRDGDAVEKVPRGRARAPAQGGEQGLQSGMEIPMGSARVRVDVSGCGGDLRADGAPRTKPRTPHRSGRRSGATSRVQSSSA